MGLPLSPELMQLALFKRFIMMSDKKSFQNSFNLWLKADHFSVGHLYDHFHVSARPTNCKVPKADLKNMF